MSRYRPGTHVNAAGWETPQHFEPPMSWREREALADKRRARRERARRTVTRKQGPPNGGSDDENL